MEVGLLTLGDHVPAPLTGRRTSQEQRHHNIREYVHSAEPLGFDALLLGEHHFSDFFISAPHLFLADVAARTTRLRLATAVTLLAYHDAAHVDHAGQPWDRSWRHWAGSQTAFCRTCADTA